MRSAIFVAMAGALALAATPALSQSITLDPVLGMPTRAVTVTGTGYASGDAIVVTFGSDLACEATVEPVGTFACTMTVPASATPGPHQVTATRIGDGTTAEATFRVRTNMTQYLGGPRHLGFIRHENVLNEHNVANLQPLWQVEFFPGFDFGQEGGSPIVVGDRVYVGTSDGRLHSRWAKTGRSRMGWPKQTGVTGQRLWAANTPAVAEGRIYIGGTDGKLYAFQVGNGAVPPGFPIDVAPGKAASSPPTYVNGRIYIGFGNTDYYAIDVSSTPSVAWHLNIASTSSAFAAPSVIDNHVYIAGLSALFGVRADDGTPLDGFPILGGNGEVFNPAIIAGNNVYAFNTSGTYGLNALRLSDGTTVPGFPLASVQPTIGSTFANGVLYFSGNDGWLSAVRARDGHQIWKTQQSGRLLSPCIYGNGLLFCNLDGLAAVIRASDGAFLRFLDAVLNFDVSVTVNDGVIYTVDMYGVLTAFGLPSP